MVKKKEKEYIIRFEGEYKNDKREGKGIFYHNNGDREMGDYLDGNPIGKHITLTIKPLYLKLINLFILNDKNEYYISNYSFYYYKF